MEDVKQSQRIRGYVPGITKKEDKYCVEDRDGNVLITTEYLDEAIDYHKQIYGMESGYSRRRSQFRPRIYRQ